MKPNELMIGDWVRNALLNEVFKMNTTSMRNMCWDEDNGMARYTIESIPLTEDILMANGFRLVNENSAYTLMVMSDDGYTIEVYICIENCVFNVEHTYTLNKERVMDRTHKCGYFVHELQHALRLCGLNELADNFKVN